MDGLGFDSVVIRVIFWRWCWLGEGRGGGVGGAGDVGDVGDWINAFIHLWISYPYEIMFIFDCICFFMAAYRIRACFIPMAPSDVSKCDAVQVLFIQKRLDERMHERTMAV